MEREKLSKSADAKKAVRSQMRARLNAHAAEERARASLEICRVIAELSLFRAARVIALFAPLPTEPDIRPLIEGCWAQGRRCVFPVMLRERDLPSLEWREVKDWNAMPLVAPFGLREPDPARCPRADPTEIDCVLVPGLAYDTTGGRLGRGSGYYDSALSTMRVDVHRIGVLFSCQQVQEVAREKHDQKLTGVVTEAGFLSLEGRCDQREDGSGR